MKSLQQYINEQQNQQINEWLLSALALACIGAFIGKVGGAVIKGVETTWNGIFESDENTDNIITEEEKKEKKKLNKIYPLQVTSEEILKKAVAATKPKPGKDGKGGHGLWTIQEKIKNNKELMKINKGEYKPNYAAFISDKKEIVGMFGFSLVYWKAKAKSSDTEEKEIAKKYAKYMHVFDIDICPEYDEEAIYDVIWKTFDAVIKEVKDKGITIKYDNEDEKKRYEQRGFKEIEGHKGYMALDMKEEKNK